MTFTASNGLTLEIAPQGHIIIPPVTTGLGEQTQQALREYFQHERDEDLGRWRDRRYPDHAVYPAPRSPQVAGRGVQVLDERTGRLYDRWEAPTSLNEWDTSPRELAARAYFEAHPEQKTAEARAGEIWEITIDDGSEHTVFIHEDRAVGGRSGVSLGGAYFDIEDSSNVLSARKVWWPENKEEA